VEFSVQCRLLVDYSWTVQFLPKSWIYGFGNWHIAIPSQYERNRNSKLYAWSCTNHRREYYRYGDARQRITMFNWLNYIQRNETSCMDPKLTKVCLEMCKFWISLWQMGFQNLFIPIPLTRDTQSSDALQMGKDAFIAAFSRRIPGNN